MPGGDIPQPITKIDGGPQQFNIDSYYYDGQPVAKAVTGPGDTKPTKPVQTAVTTVDQGTGNPAAGPVDKTVKPTKQPVDPTETPGNKDLTAGKQTGARKGNCSTINYGDSGSGAHDYDNWNADSDRSHAKPGSTADKWWQANDQLTKDLKTDNCVYTVQFGDSLSSIAQRELVTEGKAVTKQSVKDEMNLIVSLNDCHYQSLDNKQDRIQAGWKLALRGDCTGQQPAAPEPTQKELPTPPPPPQQRIEPPPPPPPPQQRVELPPPPPPPQQFPPRSDAYYPPPPQQQVPMIPMNYGLVLPPPLYMRRPLLEFEFGRSRHYPRYPVPYQYQTGGYYEGGYPNQGTGIVIDIGGNNRGGWHRHGR
jgi:hypothetical protein